MRIRFDSILGALVLIVGPLLVSSALDAQVQQPGSSAVNQIDTTPQIVQIDRHQRTWQTFHPKTNEVGLVWFDTGAVTELATGMYYQDESGNWQESQELIEVLPNAAVARRGLLKAIFSPNINTEASLDLQTVDGLRIRCQVSGLCYFDASTGQRVVLAEVKDSQAELLPPNKLIYRDAFTGSSSFKADILYTYTKAGLSQNIILREQPPSPESLGIGLNSSTTHIEVLTEFLQPPVTQITEIYVAPIVGGTVPDTQASYYVDQTPWFGSIQMGPGRAFDAQDGNGTSTGLANDPKSLVRKRFQKLDNLDFLIESVEYPAAKPHIDQLPLPPQASRGKDSATKTASLKTVPKRKASNSRVKEVRVASVGGKETGYVIDFNLLNSATNQTFRSDTTYYVSGNVILSGTTTIEGGTVIKFANTNSAQLQCDTNIVCLGSQYHPSVFTGKDDDTLGEIITGSSGTPTNYYANTGLYVPNGTTNSLHNMKFRYANVPIETLHSCGRISDVQVDSSAYGITQLYGNLTNSVHNVLIRTTTRPFYLFQSSFDIENITLDHCYYISDGGSGSDKINITNSILANITSLGSYGSLNANYNGLYNCPSITQSVGFTNSSTPFQVVGGGSYYLAANSSWLNAGTSNINATLAGELTNRTTYPPTLISGYITNAMVLMPLPIRDGDTPDLGYHYDPLDFAFGNAYTTNVVVLATNGVALGTYMPTGGVNYGLALYDGGGSFISEGTPTKLNRIVLYNVVQENSTTNWSVGLAESIVGQWQGSGKSYARSRFTDWVMLSGCTGPYHYRAYSATYELPAVFQDSQFLQGGLYTSGATLTVTNSLLDGLGTTVAVTAQDQSFFNDNLRGGTFKLILNQGGTWTVRDCLFDQPTITQTSATLVASNNAYLTNFSRLSPNGSNDVILTSVSYNTGILGRFYQLTNSPLIDAGSRTADVAGLYHFTTQSSQAKETNSVVDIGFHYVALNGSGQPVDTNGDGVPDYLSDANGNGSVDSGEIGWNLSGDLGLRILITRPRNGSPVP